MDQTDSIYLLASVDGKLVFVRQFRYPTQIESWEIAAGGTEKYESITAAAARAGVSAYLDQCVHRQANGSYGSPNTER